MTNTIKVTREQAEQVITKWLKDVSHRVHIGRYDDYVREDLAKSFVTDLFNNVLAGEEAKKAGWRTSMCIREVHTACLYYPECRCGCHRRQQRSPRPT